MQANEPAFSTAEFLRLFTQSARNIYAYILVLVPNEHAADDVFQEVSATLWEKFAEFRPGTDFYQWAKQIAYYKALHQRHQTQRGPLLFDRATLVEIAREEEQLADPAEARRAALAACFAQLDPADRALLERRYQSETRVEQLAEELGRGIHAIYRSLKRVHKQLFHCIQGKLAETEGGET